MTVSLSEKKFFNSPYERATHLLGAGVREKRKFLSVANTWERHLYKYKSINPDHLRHLIVESVFYLSPRSQLNDPFDVHSVLDPSDQKITRKYYINYLIKEHKPRHKDRKSLGRRLDSIEIIRKKISETFEKSVDSTGIHSFATCPRNILMWSYYADSHKGVCMVYETARDLDTFVKALPVTYSREFPVIKYRTEIGGELIKKAFLTKAIDWQHERERRIVEQNRASQYMHYDPSSLNGIIIGSNASQATVELIRELVADRLKRRHPPVQLYRAVCQERSYAVKIFKLRQ